MPIDKIALPEHPLELPEIRSRIANYLDRLDCVSCMSVSRDWFPDFVGPVWHTIDFVKDTKFTGIDPVFLDKYGHLIRQVLNVTSMENLNALQHAKVDSIKSINALYADEGRYQGKLADLVRRCQGRIKSIEIRCDPPKPDTPEMQQNQANKCMQPDAMFSTFSSSSEPGSALDHHRSRLRTLQLTHISLTRESFSSLLRYTSSLDELDLHQVMVLDHSPFIPLYTGSQLRYLTASFSQVWMPDQQEPAAPSLLAHFPLLERWNLTSLTRPSNWTDHTASRLYFSRHCPLLKTIRFGNDSSTDDISALLLNCFKLLTSCTFFSKNLDILTYAACIDHLQTITSITIIGDELPQEASRKWIYHIPKLCLHLEVFSIEQLAMDVETVEEHPWSCKNLKELRVRFKGLEDSQSIDACLATACSRRRSGSSETKLNAISERVIQHLLQFQQLKTVSLGSKGHYLPPVQTA
ncbi:hypothetical protein BGX29_011256 [Mortierella sp. GBA35]|nr:hypothetical protein BGX29_011256 [Mortierella sp. GBA35]